MYIINYFKKKSFGVASTLARTPLILIIIFTLFALSACQDQLEEEIHSSFVKDNFFKDPASAELGLMGIYDQLGSKTLYGFSYLLYFDTGTDEERGFRQNRGNSDDLLANYQISEDNKLVGQVWEAFYNGVYRANLVIDQVEVLRDKLASVENPGAVKLKELAQYNNILGDAYFLRGYFYYHLVKNWGDVPLRLSSNVAITESQIARTPSVKVYEQIERDMLLAIDLLPLPANVSSPGRINRTAAQGILSRIYLTWAGHPIKDVTKFEKAAEQAQIVINSGQHFLTTNIVPDGIAPEPFNTPYPENFKNLAEKVYDLSENMWEIHFAHPATSTSDAGRVGVWLGVKQSDDSGYGRGAHRRYPLPTFFNSFEVGDSARRDWSIARYEIKDGGEFVAVTNEMTYGIGKYRRYLMPEISISKNDDAMNWPIIRYSDVLLMYAEAINETLEYGGVLPAGTSIASAYDAINQVRRRARLLDPATVDVRVDLTGGAGEAFRQQIRDERSWELCFENLRKTDLTRWGILVETVRQTGNDMAAAGFSDERDYLPAAEIQEHNVLLPIPYAAEISQNIDILSTDPTNNGYR